MNNSTEDQRQGSRNRNWLKNWRGPVPVSQQKPVGFPFFECFDFTYLKDKTLTHEKPLTSVLTKSAASTAYLLYYFCINNSIVSRLPLKHFLKERERERDSFITQMWYLFSPLVALDRNKYLLDPDGGQ